jgi:gluconolactonase
VCWNPSDGSVYAGGEGGEIYAVTLEGEVREVGRTSGSMLGLACDGCGCVYACDDGAGTVVRFVPADATFETVVGGTDGAILDTPNMLAFGPDGSLYVTCSGEDGDPTIVRQRPDGHVERFTDDVRAYPNGCLVTPEGDALVVVESHAQRVVRVPIGPDGSAGRPNTVAELPDTDPDGIALDRDGALWVTRYRPDGLVRIDPSGDVEVVVDDPLARTFDAPTNLAFAGVDRSIAVVANVGDRYLSAGDLGVLGEAPHLPEPAW